MVKSLPTLQEEDLTAFYIRVSTDEQAKTGYSIEFQIEKDMEKAGIPRHIITESFISEAIKKGGVPEYRIKFYVDDGHTGEVLDRPGLDRLLEDAKQGIVRRVICYDLDRLSRKLMVQLIITDKLDRQKIELIFVNGEYANTIEGRLFFQMRGAIAEFDKEKINRQLSEGRLKKTKKGKVLKDYQIYGYDFDRETEQLVVNPEEAIIVKLIFDLCTKPESFYDPQFPDKKIRGINGIAHYLMEKEIPTKRNRNGKNVWHRQVVRQILMNPTYTGIFQQHKWNTEGVKLNRYRKKEDKMQYTLRPEEERVDTPCPVIIEKEQFDHAQMVIAEAKRRWASEGTRKYLLSGIARCGDCGNTLVGMKSRNWGKDVLVYNCSKNYAGAQNRGCNKRVPCEKFENEIWSTILNWLNNPDEIAAASEAEEQIEQSQSFEDNEIVRLEKEIEKTKNARKKLLKLFASSNEDDSLGLSEDEIKKELRDWKEKEERLFRQLEEINLKLQRNKQSEYSQYILKDAVEYYLTKNPEELSFEDKQFLIRQIVREIVHYKGDRIEIFSF
ncbi:recombinase family protein [Paenibacillus chitinolyticus]|uniref:recombinase family protein n=1 Tax=Paenibacillus chitinolyticus TaxID=79263 RepID=UPI0036DD1129